MMGFHRFSLLLALRLAIIMVCLSVLGVLIMTPGYHAGTLLAGILVVGLTWEVIRFVSRTNQELSRFLDAARYADFGQRFEFSKLGAGFAELGETFTHILDRFREDRQEQEAELRHLKALLEHVPVPLISVFGDGAIVLWNNAARRLFGSTHPTQIDDLGAFGANFQNRIGRAKAGDRFLVDFDTDGMNARLTVSVSELLIGGRTERLISLQNIQSELDGVQLSAWQDLVRVLTHEIMNSITPVASLARTAVDLVDDASSKLPVGGEVADELKDARDAVDTVARRSDSLMDFVQSYRQLTRLPEPDRRTVLIEGLFQDVARITSAEWKAIFGDDAGPSLLVNVEPSKLEVSADRKMVEQVLINLLSNARQAVAGTDPGSVSLSAKLNRRGHVVIEVTDNGTGIDPEVMDRVFVPFFTTRREGTGVGLALSRQVMIAHGGTISCSNNSSGGATFTLVF